MVVSRITCHASPRGRQLADVTTKNSDPPSTSSAPRGSGLSSISVQTSPVGGGHDAISAAESLLLPSPLPSPLPSLLPPPFAEPHSHHAPVPSATTAPMAASATIPRRRRCVGKAGSPVSGLTEPSRSWRRALF